MIRCVVSGMRYYAGLDALQEADVKADLTLPNPEYLQIQRYSRAPQWAKKKVPETISFYSRHQGALEVPRGLLLPYPVKEVANVSDRPVAFPEPVIQPREWQAKEIAHWRFNKKEAVFDSTCESPPGSGKTVGGLFVAGEVGQKTLVLVHTDAIRAAWENDIRLVWGGAVEPGLIKGSKCKIGEHITIAMVQTLRNRDPEFYAEEFGLVIVDEAHHAPTQTIYNIMRYSQSRFRFGITATPERADKLDPLIEWSCGPIRTRYKKDLNDTVPVQVTRLAIPIAIGKKTDVEWTKNKKTGRKERAHLAHPVVLERQAAHAERLELVSDLVDFLLHHKTMGGPVVIMTMRNEYSNDIEEHLIARGITSVEVLDGNTKADERIDIFDRAKEEFVKVVIGTHKMLAEGANVPCWRHIIVTQSFVDKNLVRQMSGRIERRYGEYERFPGVKNKGYVWDLVDDHRTTRMYFGMRAQIYSRLGKIHMAIMKKGVEGWKILRKKSSLANANS